MENVNGRIWNAAASEARRRFGFVGLSAASKSGVALRWPPHSTLEVSLGRVLRNDRHGELTRTRMKRWGAEPSGEFSRTTIVSVFVPVRLTSVVSGVFGTFPIAEYVEPASQFDKSSESWMAWVTLLTAGRRLKVRARYFALPFVWMLSTGMF